MPNPPTPRFLDPLPTPQGLGLGTESDNPPCDSRRSQKLRKIFGPAPAPLTPHALGPCIRLKCPRMRRSPLCKGARRRDRHEEGRGWARAGADVGKEVGIDRRSDRRQSNTAPCLQCVHRCDIDSYRALWAVTCGVGPPPPPPQPAPMGNSIFANVKGPFVIELMNVPVNAQFALHS